MSTASPDVAVPSTTFDQLERRLEILLPRAVDGVA